MLGDIDFSLKVIYPKIFLCKPNMNTIGKMQEAYDITLSVKLNGINQITFKIPYDIDVNHFFQPNSNIPLLKDRYLLRVEVGIYKEWFIINKINDNMDEDTDYKTVTAFSLGYELKDKMVRDLKLESKNAKQALVEALKYTVWTVDYIDADFELKYRTFEVQSKTVLDFVNEIAETFKAIVQYDTTNRRISLRKPELVGTNKGLVFSYGYYLKTLGKESNTDEMVTRLKGFGSEGMSIQRVNPTGQNYIENFGYFMFPFEQDASGNVIQHSDYMTDGLCKSLISYSALLETKKTNFSTLLTTSENLKSQLTTKQNEMNELKRQEGLILDIKDLQQADGPHGTLSIYDFTYNGSTTTKTMTLYNNRKYMVLGKVSSTTDIIVKVNGLDSIITANKWELLQRIQLSTSATINVSGSSTNNPVSFQICAVTDEEFAGTKNVVDDNGVVTPTPITNEELIEKYGLDNKRMQINSKQNEINLLNADITVNDNEITALKTLLSVETNFTPGQITELNSFVIEKEFTDENIVDDKDLFETLKKRFEELRLPQTVIEIDIVNFLEVIEENENWHKLVLGDTITIKYEKMNVKVQAKIIEVEYNFGDGSIKLKIANIKDIETNADKLMKYIYNSISTSTLVDMNKYKWNATEVDLGAVSDVIKFLYDRTKKEIDMAINETVIIDRRGITIYDPNDPLKFLRATHGILGITDDGGNTYKHAITYFGIVGERIYGRIITGERVVIGDPDGILEIRGNKGVVTDKTGREVMWFGLYDQLNDKYGLKLENDKNQIFVDRDEGFKITAKNPGTGQWDNKFYVDNNGLLWAEDMTAKRLKIISDSGELLLDSFTKYMDIGKFDNIIVDGKLTAIEKLQVKGEMDRIHSEYQKLKTQADIYTHTTRDATLRIDTTAFTNAYNALVAYINPLIANMTATTVIDRDYFISMFKKYYDEALNIVNAISDSLKYSSLQLGTYYNNVVIDAANGIEVVRSDNLVRTRLNATEGISIERFNGTIWQKKFYADINGHLWAEDLTAKRIKVVNDLNEELLNSDTSYMNIARFSTIVVDGKLTPLEKVMLKGEWERIKSEYQKLLAQANAYATTSRDGSIRFSTTPLTNAYTALNNYVVPLLVNMHEVTTIDRDDFINKFKTYFDEATAIINMITDSLKYSSLQLGSYYNNVLIDAADGITVTRSDNLVRSRLNATDGFSIENNVGGIWVKKFYVDTTGKLQVRDIEARRLILNGNNGELLLDADQKVLRLDNFNLIVGMLSADKIFSKTLVSGDGYISDLIVNRLKTIGSTTSGTINFIDIKDNSASWVTATITESTQATDSNGSLLYWTDGSHTKVTTNDTGIPYNQYTLSSSSEKLKMFFEGTGASAFPIMVWGEGDGAGFSKGYMVKRATSFEMYYSKSNTGDMRGIYLSDVEGVEIYNNGTSGCYMKITDDNRIAIGNQSSFIQMEEDGRIHLGNTSTIEVLANGDIVLTHTNGSTMTMGNDIVFAHSSGSTITIGNDIDITAIGNVGINGTRIDLN